jgi:protein N-terminal amidase
MRIATLQFAPRLGDVQGNIRRANELLWLDSQTIESDGQPSIDELQPDILVLPEMAFSGK